MGVPLQVFEMGVTVIKPVTGVLFRLVALNDAIEPDPVGGIPMSELVFVQLYTVPGTLTKPTFGLPVNRIGPTDCVPQISMSETAATDGIGFTCKLNCTGSPEQLLDTGVTVINADTGIFALLVEVNPGIVPVPVVDAKPIAGFVFVQLYCVFPTPDPVNEIVGINVPLHTC